MIYVPHDYQKYAIEFIENKPTSALLLDMGLGKTSITLTAINNLLFDSFEVHKVLVIAPLRVARDTWKNEIHDFLNSKTIDLERGEEYASYIFNAVFGDNTMFKFNGNVRNFNLISNLPYGCCVEVPIVASKNKLEAVSVGSLPDQLAVLINTSARCEELAVQGALEHDAKKVFWAIAFDPLTSAVLSLDEIKKMVEEMFEFNKNFLPWYKGIDA